LRWLEATKARRVASALVLAALVSAPFGTVRGEDAADAEIRAPVERLYGALSAIVPEAGELGYAGRHARLEPVIREAYDLPFMAAKSLGRHWSELSEADRERFVDVFSRLTVATYADRFDRSGPQGFEVLAMEPAAQGTSLVRTRIVPEGDEPVELDYRVRKRGDAWRIIDVFLNGTVSELAVRRSEYSGIVKRDGFAALVAALEKKIAEAEADPASS
jgi:phospholipid transport system substrate-binding protein